MSLVAPARKPKSRKHCAYWTKPRGGGGTFLHLLELLQHHLRSQIWFPAQTPPWTLDINYTSSLWGHFFTCKMKGGASSSEAPVSRPTERTVSFSSPSRRHYIDLFWKTDPQKGYRKNARIILGVWHVAALLHEIQISQRQIQSHYWTFKYNCPFEILCIHWKTVLPKPGDTEGHSHLSPQHWWSHILKNPEKQRAQDSAYRDTQRTPLEHGSVP